MADPITSRDDDPVDDSRNDDDVPWIVSNQAYAIRWAIILGLVLSFLLFILLSHLHAQSRMKKGLPPLAYHRWLVPRSKRAPHDPSLRPPEQEFSFYQNPHNPPNTPPGYNNGAYYGYGGYAMQPVPPPYNPNYAQPPGYNTTAGGSAGVEVPSPAALAAANGDRKVDPFAEGGSGSSSPHSLHSPVSPGAGAGVPQGSAPGVQAPPPAAGLPVYRYN